MKRIVITLLITVLTVSLFIPVSYANVSEPLSYSVSGTKINLNQAGAGRFSITIPNSHGAYNSVAFEIEMPKGGKVNSVSYDIDDVRMLGPDVPPGGQKPDSYFFSFFVLESDKKLTSDLVCIVDLTYTGKTEQSMKIVEIKKSVHRGIDATAGNHTDDYISGQTTITLVPYSVSIDDGYYRNDDVNVNSDATLLSLSIFRGTVTPALSPPFSPKVTDYKATVVNSVSAINVSASPTSTNAKVTGNRMHTLNVGENKITVRVTAGNGATKDYTITVTRLEPGVVLEEPDDKPKLPNDPPIGPGDYTGSLEFSTQNTPQSSLLMESGAKGYVSGYPDNTIRAQNNITRYETAVMFYNAISDVNKASYAYETSKFTDAESDSWYSEAVGYLVSKEVLSGYPDGTFRGDNQITRAEFATLASKFTQWNLAADIPFQDVPTDNWAYVYIRSAYNNGLISGYPDGTFGHGRNIIRAETFVVMNKLIGWDSKSVSGGKVEFSDLTGNEWYINDIVLAVKGQQL